MRDSHASGGESGSRAAVWAIVSPGRPAKTYLRLVAVLGAISGVVVVEPSPYDVMLPILLVAGLAGAVLLFRQPVAFPLATLAVFVVGNVVSMIGIRSAALVDGAQYLAITAYLVLSWAFFVGLLGRFGYQAVKAFFAGYVAGACVAVVMVVGGLLGASSTLEGLVWAGRAVALFKDPNVFGPFLIPVALYAALNAGTDRDRLRRAGWMFVLILASLGVLLSLSRAAWGSYALGALVYALFAFPGSRGLVGRLALLGMIGLAVMLPVWHAAGHEYGELLFSRVGLQPYDDLRFATQAQAVATSLGTWHGIGPGQAETVFDYATHSLYLRVLAENGWLSALAGGAFLLATLTRSIRGLRSQTGWRPYFAFCTAALVSVLFNSLFIDSLHWRHFWLVCALPWIPYETAASHHAR